MQFTRRSFIEKLSLGTGAALLSSLMEGMVREAHGQTSRRKRIVFVISSNGWNDRCYVPGYNQRVFKETASFEAPQWFTPLAKYRSRMLLTDGLNNDYQNNSNSHRHGFAELSCVRGQETPGGQTFDQYLAATLGKDSAFKSVTLAAVDPGYRNPPPPLWDPWLSATAAGKPVTYQTRPGEAFATLFGGGSGSMSANNTPNEARLASLRKKSVFDFMLNDIKRAHTTLGASERNKLDEYLSSIRALESRRARSLEDQIANPITCDSAAGALSHKTLEDGIEGHFEVATRALTCGLTQVVSISPGIFDFYYRKIFPQDAKAHTWGHDMSSAWGIAAYNTVHEHVAKQIAKMADSLAAAKEGDGSMLDNTVIVWLNDAGMFHHSRHERQPAVILGNAGGALRADGRYLGFPDRESPTHQHALADLYVTLAHALGVPNNDFGKGPGSLVPVKGIIKELV